MANDEMAIVFAQLHAKADRADENFRREMKLMVSTIIKKLDDMQATLDNVDRAQVIADWQKSRPT